jgi:hypothetical protein
MHLVYYKYIRDLSKNTKGDFCMKDSVALISTGSKATIRKGFMWKNSMPYIK